MDETVSRRAEGARSRLETFSSLRNGHFRLFWIGTLFSFTGMHMQNVAQGWLVLELTNSATYLGVVSAITSISAVFFALFGGVAADRFERRNLLIVTQSGILLQALMLGILIYTGLIQIWHVVIASFLIGVVNSFNGPARQAFVVDLVSKQDLMNAVALNSAGANVTRSIGPALGGIVVSTLGIAAAFFLKVVGYSVVIATIFMIPVKGGMMPAAKETVWNNIAGGIEYLKKNRIMVFLILCEAIPTMFAQQYQTLMPIFAKDVLRSGVESLGLLTGAAGIGAVIGSLLVASLGNFRRKGLLLLVACLLYGVIIVFFANSTSFWLSMALLVLIGAMSMIYMATANTLVQYLVPDELRGRIVSLLNVAQFLLPLGALQAGYLADQFGAPFSLTVGGALVVVAVAAMMVFMPALRRL